MDQNQQAQQYGDAVMRCFYRMPDPEVDKAFFKLWE